ncbi:ABC transporter permease [Paenibacillus apiarius]|uniref:ABC transporter permease n=1 Tax=Paenibacillus apiarius TaxID=46240 RepID=A0ABT4E026_9BACL|nr:ABC transporter permease [Paenibacillus apiarius]MCY9515055.1 ABC transporter permease [Paenibacillus apiarius]MCY9522959.1 ABC transporter permease [Paenibacillus apiarius]MCY9553762.1 ABC transporter permease [Paenibacillus apiarius]MCY9556405.1 ABC transporter permease [Paenibacillus apiarius]MCY9684839.1 ABC transporter permease [Paenibacillus apiarius]
MRYFISLVQNEWMKANSKRQVPYYYAFLAVISLLLAVGMRFFIFKDQPYSFISFTSDVHFISNALTSIFIMVISAQIITDEYKDGTIKQLLIRPASRTMVLMSKLVNIMLIMLVVYLFTLFIGLALGAIFFNVIPADVKLIQIAADMALGLPNVLFYALVAFTTAVLTHSLGLSITIPIVLKSVVGSAIYFLANKSWYKFLIFPNMDWKPYFTGDADMLPFKGATLGYSIAVYAVYMIVLLGISIFVFKKRDVQ